MRRSRAIEALATVLSTVIRIRLEDLSSAACRSALMRYAATRGGVPPQPFTDMLLAGFAPTAAWSSPNAYPGNRSGDARSLASIAVRRPRVRDSFAVLRRHPERGPARPRATDLQRRALRQRRDRQRASDMATLRGRGARLTCSACRKARRSRSRTWRCNCSGNCSSTSSRSAASAAQHPRRDLRRHRLGGRIRDARQVAHPRLHAVARTAG